MALDLSLSAQAPFSAILIEGIPYVFTDSSDSRLTITALGLNSNYTIKPYISSLPINTEESIDFFGGQSRGPGTMQIDLQDRTNELLTQLLSSNTTAKSRLNGAITTSSTSIVVDATATVGASVGDFIYVGKETFKFASQNSTTYTLTNVTFRGLFNSEFYGSSKTWAHNDDSFVSKYPRFWRGRRVKVLLGDLSDPASYVVIFQGVLQGIRESSLGIFQLTVDDVFRLMDKTIFDNMRGKVLHIGKNQITVKLEGGNNGPKRPEDFQTTYSSPPAVFPQTMNDETMHLLSLDGDESGKKFFFRPYQNPPGSAVGYSCAVWPLINSSFDDWTFSSRKDLGSETRIYLESGQYMINPLRDNIFEERLAPYGWKVNGGSARLTNQRGEIVDSGISGQSYIDKWSGSSTMGDNDDLIYWSSASAGSCVFNFGNVATPLSIEQRFELFDAEDFELVINHHAFGQAAFDYYLVLQDAVTSEYYDWAGAWSSSADEQTVATTNVNSWERSSYTVTMDRARTLILRIGNQKADTTLSAVTNKRLAVDDIQIKIDYTASTATSISKGFGNEVPETGPAIITFFNVLHSWTDQFVPPEQFPYPLSYESSLNYDGNPQINETYMLRGTPLNIARTILQSVDGNGTDQFDVLPEDCGLGLTSQELDTTSLDKAHSTFDPPFTMTVFIDKPINALEYVSESFYKPYFLYPVSRSGSKLSLVGLSAGLKEWDATTEDFAAAATIVTSSVMEPPTYTDGSNMVSNQIKYSIDYLYQSDKWLTNLVFNRVGDSKSYYGAGINTFTVKSRAHQYTMANSNYSDVYFICLKYFSHFALGKPVYRLVTDLRYDNSVFIGDIIVMSDETTVDIRNAVRGLSSENLWVISKRTNRREGTIEFEVAPKPMDSNPGYVAPTFEISGISGADYTVVANRYTISSDSDVKHIKAGDKVTCWNSPATGATWTATSKTVSAVNTSTRVITLNSAAAGVGVGDIITFDAWGTVVSTQQNRVFLAAATGLIDSSGEAFTYA